MTHKSDCPVCLLRDDCGLVSVFRIERADVKYPFPPAVPLLRLADVMTIFADPVIKVERFGCALLIIRQIDPREHAA